MERLSDAAIEIINELHTESAATDREKPVKDLNFDTLPTALYVM